jgi:hypothetical protein
MTLPNQEKIALLNTIRILYELMDSKKTPNTPKHLREKARACLSHFPSPIRINELYNVEK